MKITESQIKEALDIDLILMRLAKGNVQNYYKINMDGIAAKEYEDLLVYITKKFLKRREMEIEDNLENLSTIYSYVG